MTSDTSGVVLPHGLLPQVMAWAGRVGLAKKLAIALTAASVVAGVATYAALNDTPPFGTSAPETVTLLLTLDLVLLLLLGLLVARRMVQVWMRRRRGQAGSRLHVRLVLVFSLLAVVPAIIVATFSTTFFYVGVQSWFSERVRTAVNESLAVAQAYLHEHQQNIRAEVLAMTNDINREAPRLFGSTERFDRVLTTQAALRGLAEAIVFDGTTGQVLGRSAFSFALTFDPPPEDAVQRARSGEVVLLVTDTDDRMRALVRLDRFVDSYLYVGRLVEPRVLAHLEKTEDAVKEYAALEAGRSSLQITVTMIFVVVCLLLLLAAAWTGLNFANQLATPISALIGAAERVRAGDLAVRVAEERMPEDELGTLMRAFNRMTSQIEGQRTELIDANTQLDLRRRFTEAVLAGVSAGVLGLDQDGVINLPNQSAAQLLGVEAGALIGQPLAAAVPEMAELIEAIQRRPGKLVEAQVELARRNTRRTLLVRIAAEVVASEVRGFVVTFDDISELLSAQRKAAWADVARRIAHEIKNPLTPIQLSAERLRRKYLKEIASDQETFQICTDTIIRHVLDIGRMVDEFSAFARMPNPVMKPVVVHDLCRQAVFLQQSAHPGVTIACDLPAERVSIPCDQRQISQALTNLLQNALDAIEGRPAAADGGPAPAGRIDVRVARDDDRVVIAVEDNGKGLPTGEERRRLTEPYVTTRTKGTGLGLAIVRKIMEDHGGDLVLEDRAEGGARVSLIIPLNRPAVAVPDDRSVGAPSPDRPASPQSETAARARSSTTEADGPWRMTF